MKKLGLLLLLAACSHKEPAAAQDKPADKPAAEEPVDTSEIPSGVHIAQIEGKKWTATDELPPAIHGHGEALRDSYVAPDGVQFLSGYMYTGVDGPDTGVVYRKDPGGAWKIVFSKKENELHILFGSGSSDVYAAGVHTLEHWDGKAWSEIQVPDVQGTFSGGWTDGKQVLVATSDWDPDAKKGWIYRRDEKGAWTLDGTAKNILFAIGGTGDTIYAVGQDGLTLHRTAAGAWTDETFPNGYQVTNISVLTPNDIYSAGSSLMHSTGDGAWTKVVLPKKAQVISVWGRASNDVYAGTLGGLFHFDGTSWSATRWRHGVETIAGNATLTLIAQDN